MGRRKRKMVRSICRFDVGDWKQYCIPCNKWFCGEKQIKEHDKVCQNVREFVVTDVDPKTRTIKIRKV